MSPWKENLRDGDVNRTIMLLVLCCGRSDDRPSGPLSTDRPADTLCQHPPACLCVFLKGIRAAQVCRATPKGLKSSSD